MAKIFSATFILVLFVVAFFNGYIVEGGGRCDKLEKDNDNIYKSMKFGQEYDCDILDTLCLEFSLIYFFF
jgi:hypothetical protein